MTGDWSQFLGESDKSQTQKVISKLACYENALPISYCLTVQKWSFPLRISSVNVTKSLKENFIFRAVVLLKNKVIGYWQLTNFRVIAMNWELLFGNEKAFHILIFQLDFFDNADQN